MFASTVTVGLLAFAALRADGEQFSSVAAPPLYVAIDDGSDGPALFVAVDGGEATDCSLVSEPKTFGKSQRQAALDQLSRKR